MSRATPLRLLRADGEWLLEVEGLERVSPVVYRPKRSVVEGEDRILLHLGKRKETAHLGSEAAEIMQTLRDAADDVVFDNHDGTWLRGDRSATAPLALGPSPQDLQQRIETLERENAELRDRLAALEASLRAGGPPRGAAAAPPPEPEPELAPDTPEPAESDAQMDATPELEEELNAAPPQDTGWQGPALQLPPYTELTEVLASLVDGAAPSEAAMPMELGPEVIDVYGCTVTDVASGEVIGALLANVSAVAQCGGRMVGESEEAIAEAEADEMASDEMIEGLEQIFNVMISKINGIDGNPEVELGGAGLFDFARYPWITENAQKREIADGLGGQFVVVARQP